ncbi:MAG: Flp family type IVb pilin [Proteobacteria bacterium]|nr:Flp family type IVb pilin [Pseudomonadota bacterium]
MQGKVMLLIENFIKQDQGVTAIEYVLIAILIGLAILVGAALIGTSLNNEFTAISTHLHT